MKSYQNGKIWLQWNGRKMLWLPRRIDFCWKDKMALLNILVATPGLDVVILLHYLNAQCHKVYSSSDFLCFCLFVAINGFRSPHKMWHDKETQSTAFKWFSCIVSQTQQKMANTYQMIIKYLLFYLLTLGMYWKFPPQMFFPLSN